MVLFPMALLLVRNFGKIKVNKIKNKKFNFSIEFSSKIFKISEQFVFFVEKREKFTHSLLDFYENMQK